LDVQCAMGKGYVIGGQNSDYECLNSIECLDLSVSPPCRITMDQGLETARSSCKCSQVFILSGNLRYTSDSIDLFSVGILNTETGQVIYGPPLPQYRSFAAAAVNDELLCLRNALKEATNGSPIQWGKQLRQRFRPQHLLTVLLTC
jgi:hypothetical protein